MLENLKSKIDNYAAQLETANSTSNFLSRVKNELETVYNDLVKAAPTIEAVVGVIYPAAVPAISATVNTVEAVVNAA